MDREIKSRSKSLPFLTPDFTSELTNGPLILPARFIKYFIIRNVQRIFRPADTSDTNYPVFSRLCSSGRYPNFKKTGRSGNPNFSLWYSPYANCGRGEGTQHEPSVVRSWQRNTPLDHHRVAASLDTSFPLKASYFALVSADRNKNCNLCGSLLSSARKNCEKQTFCLPRTEANSLAFK